MEALKNIIIVNDVRLKYSTINGAVKRVISADLCYIKLMFLKKEAI